MAVEQENPGRVRRERDLYRQLLELGRRDEIEPFLEEALTLIVQVTGAARGYLELHDDRRGGASALFWLARGCSDEEVPEIRGAFSRGVIAETLASGATFVTASALDDPRLRKSGSVRRHGTKAVLCAPIGAAPPLGVLYLQDRALDGDFTDEDRLLAETFASTVAVFADRLLLRRRQREEADPTLPYRRVLRTEGIVGRSQALATLLKQVSVAAPIDVGVLLTGSPGTGKTRIARLCHDNSPRAAAPFVELNCANFTETLFESEFFGYEKGAHNMAAKRTEGKVAAAEKGTLFLDEVAEIPLPFQSKLLTFLDKKTYYLVGGTQPVKADVRIIAATNVDLQAAVKRGAFREDLYWRLHVMPLSVPSLAERRDDIADFVRHLCQVTVETFKLPSLELSEGAVRAAEAAEWPGNIRQLANVVQRAVVTAASERVLHVERRHLFPDGEGVQGASPAAGATPPATYQDATRAFQAELVRRTLEEVEWNVARAATRLDVTRAHVYNLINAFELGRRRR